MIKFGHITDTHICYSSGQMKDPNTKINLREQDGYNAVEEAINAMIEEGVDFVLHTGDWFHSPKPSIYAITKSQELLDKLVENNIPFYCLAGNHDSTDAVKDIPSSRILHQPKLNLFSYTEPYIIQEIPDSNVVLHMVSHHGFIAQKETFKEVKPIEGKFNILCTHGSVWDENLGLILHSEGEPREVVVPENILNLNWDYVLLGHIHERGWVGSTDGESDTSGRKIFYGGSTIRRGYSDKPCKLGRGWTKWSIDEEKSEMTPEFFHVKQRPQYDIFIDCNDKTIQEIENEITSEFKKLDLDETPIVRFNLVDIDLSTKILLKWDMFKDYTSKCLTFTTKITTKEEVRKELTKQHFSFNLTDAYKEFWKETKENYNENVRKDIEKYSVQFLRDGQSKLLDE